MADPAMKQPTRLRGILLLCVVFVLGLVCGGALLHIGQHTIDFRSRWPKHHEGRDHPFRHMARELELDEEQAEQVHEILQRSRTGVHSLLDEAHAEIRALLRPDQIERLEGLHSGRPGMGHLPLARPRDGQRKPPPPPD